MTASSWSWLKHRFATSFATEAAPLSNHSSQQSTAGPPSCTKLNLGTAAKKEVILVTGGAGFVGQHVVRLLQERASNIAEIRVFDTHPYRNKLGHKELIPVRPMIGDVRKLTELRIATRDVTTVIHAAGVVSYGTFPDVTAMHDVNAKGTANVIQACVEQNVQRLLYTSTVDVVIGPGCCDVISGGDEALPVPRKFLFYGYPESKRRAELLVCEANGRPLAKGDGSVLHTLVLRPTVMYGELDPWYVVSGLQAASRRGGVLMPIGDDDTPIRNAFQVMKPFLEARGYTLASSYLPYPLAYAMFLITDWILWMIRPIYEVNLEVSLPSVVYANRMLTFSRQLAEETLGYQPIYDHVTSLQRSIDYYRHVPL